MGAGLLLLAACKPSREPLPTVEELMEDRVTLDGIILKCGQSAGQQQLGAECELARIAVERLARKNEAAEQAKRQEEFERNREKLRQNDEQRARAQAEQKKVDPYTMPVVERCVSR
jgi:hypothetical protein